MKEEQITGGKSITKTERKAKLTQFPASEIVDPSLLVSWKFSVAKQVSFKNYIKLFGLQTVSFFLCNNWSIDFSLISGGHVGSTSQWRSCLTNISCSIFCLTILLLDKQVILLPAVSENKSQLETCNSSRTLVFNFVDFLDSLFNVYCGQLLALRMLSGCIFLIMELYPLLALLENQTCCRYFIYLRFSFEVSLINSISRKRQTKSFHWFQEEVWKFVCYISVLETDFVDFFLRFFLNWVILERTMKKPQ